MIMMGPKKDKGGMVSIIIEKMKDHYGNGKESNEDYVEGKHDEEKEHEVYEHYREEVDGMLDAIKNVSKVKETKWSTKKSSLSVSRCLSKNVLKNSRGAQALLFLGVIWRL